MKKGFTLIELLVFILILVFQFPTKLKWCANEGKEGNRENIGICILLY